MARKRQPALQVSRRLMLAMALVTAAAVALFLLFDGEVYRATSGAEIGLWATVAVLFAGMLMAGLACWLALSTLVRDRRRLENVVKLERKDHKRAA